MLRSRADGVSDGLGAVTGARNWPTLGAGGDRRTTPFGLARRWAADTAESGSGRSVTAAKGGG